MRHIGSEHAGELSQHGVTGAATRFYNRNSAKPHVLSHEDVTAELQRLRSMNPELWDSLPAKLTEGVGEALLRILARGGVAVSARGNATVNPSPTEMKSQLREIL